MPLANSMFCFRMLIILSDYPLTCSFSHCLFLGKLSHVFTTTYACNMFNNNTFIGTYICRIMRSNGFLFQISTVEDLSPHSFGHEQILNDSLQQFQGTRTMVNNPAPTRVMAPMKVVIRHQQCVCA